MKKILLVLSFLLPLGFANAATTLWEFYNGDLPTIEERALFYHGNDKYIGTAEQNTRLLLQLGGGNEESGLILGAFNPTAGGTYRLQSSVGTSDTSITLSSFKEPVSNIKYTMSYLNSAIEYGTLEPNNNTKKELISFSGITQNSDGSATLTGVSRGLSFSYPYTASTTLQQTHSGQSIFILSDAPQLFTQYAVKQNDETITGDWLVPAPANATSIANRAYVDGAYFGGIGGASETATGTVEIATGLEAASSTTNGTLGRLALPASLATSTYNSNTADLKVVVTGNNGKIDPNFLTGVVLTSGNNTFTGVNTLATTTATSTMIGSFPAYWIGKNIQVITTTGTSTFTVPSGINKVHVRLVGGGGGGGSATGGVSTILSSPGGGGGGYSEEYVDVTGTTTIQVYVAPSVAAVTDGKWTTFGTNGFYLYATGGLKGASNCSAPGCSGGLGGSGSDGDINLSGQRGGTAYGQLTASADQGSVITGYGGASMFGEQSYGQVLTYAGTSIAGANGVNYGGGGGGAAGSQSNAGTGGTGAQGIIIITW